MASSPITSTMQDDFQLTITAILRHGAAVHGRSESVTWLGDHGRHTSYAEIARNAERLAAALTGLGIGPGDRFGTFCWNTRRRPGHDRRQHPAAAVRAGAAPAHPPSRRSS